MIVLVGRLWLVAALAGAVVTVAAGWATARRGVRHPWLRRGALLTLGGMVGAFVTLEVALLGDRFEVQYVAEHHRRATSTFFTITSAWAGLEGSLLLWGTVIAGYLGLVALRVTRGDAPD